MLPEDHKTPFGTPPIPPVEQSAQLPPELSNPEGTPLQQPGEEIAPSGPVNDLGETAVEQLAPSPSQPVTPVQRGTMTATVSSLGTHFGRSHVRRLRSVTRRALTLRIVP